MDILNFITVIWATASLREIEARQGLDKFIKSYVENERKSTMVVFNGICWSNRVKVNLIRELSRAGIRSSSSVPTRSSYQDTAVLLVTDLDCPGTEEVFENATRQNHQKLPYRWLVLTSSPVQMASPFWDHFLVNSDMVVAEADGLGYTMTEIHKTVPTGPAIRTARGVYTDVLTDVRPHREFFRRRRDLMGLPLTITNLIQDSNRTKYHMVQEDRLALHHDYSSKNSWTLARLGFLMLNATPRAVFNYGVGYTENGEWTGLMKDLIDNKADIGTSIGMTKERFKAVAYIDILDNTRLRFIFRQPALSYTSNVYILPFSAGVWMATIITTIVAALAFNLSTRWNGMTRENRDGTLGDAFLLTFTAISQQGCELQPRKLSARIILWVIFTSLMALYAAYGANIVVLLQAPSSSINDLLQLSKSKLSLGAHDVYYNHYVFKGNKDPVRNAISRRIEKDNGPKPFYNLTEGVKRLRKGLFAFHAVVDLAYREVEKTFLEMEKCDLVEIDYIGYKGMYVPAYKHSPYLELLRVVFKQIREAGIKSAVNYRLEVRKPSCKESVAVFNSVGVIELRAVLLFMVYSVAFSVAVLAMEILVYHLNRRLQKGSYAKQTLKISREQLIAEKHSSNTS